MESEKDVKTDGVEILIVEDSPTQAIKLQFLLEQNNYRVSVAQNGLDAVTFLEKHRPTLIISDIVMPKMDGFELCRKIKKDKNLKNIPVILLTTLSEPEDIVKGLTCGADNFITKPFEETFLLSRIEYILVNKEIRQNLTAKMGIELFFAGKKHFIRSDRMQILDLLFSTYEGAIQKGRELEHANKELRKTRDELKALTEQLEQKVFQRTTRIKHLNSMILAVQNVNQLIVKEKDRDRLIQGVCDKLAETSKHYKAWIVLLNESGEFVKASQAGMGKDFLPVIERLKSNELTDCARRALAQPGVVVIQDPSSTCSDCPLADKYSDYGNMCSRLEHAGKIYGLLSYSIPKEFITDEEEQRLSEEVAGDVAFGLYSMELEKGHKRAVENLQRSEASLAEAQRIAHLGNWDLDLAKNEFQWSDEVYRIFGLTPQELKVTYELFINSVHPDDRELVRKAVNETLEKKTNYCIDHRIILPGGEERFVHEQAELLVSEDGTPIKMVGTVQDITGRKQAEEALRESEATISSVFQAAPVGICIMKGRVYQKVNKNWCDSFGYTEENILGKSTRFLYENDEEYQRVGRELHKLLLEQGLTSVETRLRRSDGVFRDVILMAAPRLPDDLEAGTVVTVQDITERKRAEETLRESEQKLRTVCSSAQDAIIMIDNKGNISFWNEAAEKIFGYTENEALGMVLHTLIIPEKFHDAYRKAFRGFKKTGQGVAIGQTLELSAVRKGGTEFPVELALSSVKIKGKWNAVGIVRDITERKRAERDRVRLETALEQAAEAIVITDPSGNIQYVNPAFEKITGYGKDEAVGKNPRILKSGQQDEAFYSNLWETISAGKVWKGRFINRRKDGTFYHEEATISPVKDSSGKIVNCVAVKRDISQELELENQLNHSQKMESIGLLAGGVAHDFNNILTTVMGYSSSMKRAEDLPERLKKRAEEIEKASQRGADITRQLLTFSRKQAPKLEAINLNDAINNSIRFFKKALGPAIEIETDLAQDLWPSKADGTQIQQVLMNLGVNARDSMPDGGKITIQTSNIDIDQNYVESHLYAKAGPYVLMSLTDTGDGMDKATLSRIFEPFFTTKPLGKGTGLGLSIIYGIIKNHKGLIHAYSEVGKGTSFKIYLPRATGKAKAQVTDEPSVKGGNETILVVDDEEMIRKLVTSILGDYGYKCLIAENGFEALEIYRKEVKKIDLVLLDIVMPKMGGSKCFEELLKINPRVRAVMSSGFSVQDEKTFLKKGVKAFVPKPYQERYLARTVREVLDKDK